MSLVGSCMTPQPCPAGSSSSLAAEANTAACEAVSGGVWGDAAESTYLLVGGVCVFMGEDAPLTPLAPAAFAVSLAVLAATLPAPGFVNIEPSGVPIAVRQMVL